MRMKTTLGCGLMLALASAVAAQDADQALGAERADDSSKPGDYIGVYRIASGEDDGEPLPEEGLRGHVVRITADMIVVLDAQSNALYSCKYTLKPDSDPNRLDMESTGGPPNSVGQTARGIITRGTNDEGKPFVMLCYRTVGEEYPDEFRTRAESETNLFVLEPIPDPAGEGTDRGRDAG